MTLIELLDILVQKNIQLSLKDGALKVKAAKGSVTAPLAKAIKELKPELVDFLERRQRRGNEVEQPRQLVRVARDEYHPTSFSQQRLWFVDQLEGKSPQYNIPGALKFTGKLNIVALQGALDAIVERHEVLRSVYIEVDGQCCQHILPARAVELVQTDLTSLTATEQEQQVQSMALHEAQKPFDLAKDLMLRTELLVLGNDSYVLLFTMHHIASDGWSSGIVVKEFATLYQVFCDGKENPLTPLDIQYVDYAHWQRDGAGKDGLSQQLNFWKKRLAGIPQLHSLPLDKPRGDSQNFIAKRLVRDIDLDQLEGINQLARDHDATLFMVLQSTFALLLSRYSGENDIVMGVPTAGRGQSALEGLIGFFINTLVLRSDINLTLSYSELLQQTASDTLSAFANQDLPFETLVDELKPDRALSYNPVCQVKFVLQNHQEQTGERFELPNLSVSSLKSGIEYIRFDLDLTVVESPRGLQLNWSYKQELFEQSTIERMSDSFSQLLRQIVAAPQTQLQDLLLLSQTTKAQIESYSVGPLMAIDTPLPLHEKIAMQAQRTPDAIAVSSSAGDLTYRQLNQKANRLADALIEQGVEHGEAVAVCSPRSAQLLVALLGVMKAGGVYISLEPSLSAQRIEYILADAKAQWILCHSNDVEDVSTGGGADVILLDGAVDDDNFLSEYSDADPQSRGEAGLQDSAYLVYTSGSTGQPKGVEITQRGLVDYLYFALGHYYQQQLDGSLVVTSHSFDITVPSLYLPLLAGDKVVLCDSGDELSQLAQLVQSNEPSNYLLRMTPMHVKGLLHLLEHNDSAGFEPAHVFVIGGEAFAPSLAKDLQQRFPNAQIYNHYGPSETVVGCSIFDVTANISSIDDELPIGQPMSNTQLYVLDQNLQLCPIGVTGELYIGGDGVAVGYVNQPQLSGEKFIESPFGAGRLYRSGDLVRRRSDGQLVFVRRDDDQVKLRGFRIELGEIEAQLLALEQVSDAVVLLKGQDENQQLVAYVVTDIAEQQLKAHLQVALKDSLPTYMMPSAYVALETIPLSDNGKIDKAALPQPDEVQGDVYIAPQNDTQRQLAEIWQEVLGKDEISIESNFFAIGGHSIMATQIVSRIKVKFEKLLTVRALFEYNTIALLAEYLDSHDFSTGSDLVVQKDRRDMPLSFAQQRLWFIEQLEPDNVQFNISGALALHGVLDLDAMERAINRIIERHEVLRTVYQLKGELPVQNIQPFHYHALNLLDLTDLPKDQQDQEVVKQVSLDARTGFDLEHDLMFRSRLLRLADDHHVILFTLHHIASDGWSMGIVTKEFVKLYEAYSNSKQDPFAGLEVQYGDFACWQRQSAQGKLQENQLAYWQQNLQGIPQVHSLPLDKARSTTAGFKGERISTGVRPEIMNQLKALALSHDASLFMVLQGAFATLLARMSRETDIVMGTPVANRSHEKCEGLIGLFLNTLVLRMDLSANPNFNRLIALTRETHLQAHQHADVPFESLVEHLNPQRNLTHAPLFQVLINMNTTTKSSLDLPGLSVTSVGDKEGFDSKYDLTLYISEFDDGISLNFSYNAQLFNKSTMTTMAEQFIALLSALVKSPDTPVLDHPWADAKWQQINVVERPLTPVHQLINAHQSDAIAIITDDEVLTYGQLNQKVNRLANYLQDKVQIELGQRIGIHTERSCQRVIAILAALRAGGVYVPLSQEFGFGRLEYMVEDAQLSLILSDEACCEKAVEFAGDVRVIPIDGKAGELWSNCPTDAPKVAGLTDDSLSHIIYTSGSTGHPKGVKGTHQSLTNRIGWMLDAYDLQEKGPQDNDVYCHITSMAFIRGVWELMLPLCAGAPMRLVDRDVVKDPALLLQDLCQHKVTSIVTAPSLMAAMLASVTEQHLALPPLRRWFVSGEAFAVGTAAWATQVLGKTVQVVNLYGSTEVMSDVLHCDVASYVDKHVIALGEPIDNVSVTVVDSRGNPVPQGIMGELVVSGICTGEGYQGLDQLTKNQFIQVPDISEFDGRSYRTGDLVRRLDNADLIYLGRFDHQLKVRGYRIELGEIEAALSRQADVKTAVMMAEPHGDDTRLIAYLVLERDDALSRVKSALASQLPDFMQPMHYQVLPVLPYKANGKVDRQALPKVDWSGQTDYVEPEGEMAQQLAKLFEELLSLEQPVSATANFFDLGGHSLLATRLVGLVYARLSRRISVRSVFECRHLADLASHIELQPVVMAANIDVRPDDVPTPLSYSQQRLWFIDELEGSSVQYNIPTALLFKGTLDKSALEKTLVTILQRHESLRTCYQEHDGEVVQTVNDGSEFAVIEIDLSYLGLEEANVQARDLAKMEAQTPFDLTQDLMLRVHLLVLDEQEHVLLLTMHHIASDGWSKTILIREFCTLYTAFCQGNDNPLRPLAIQYGDYAYWQRSAQEQSDVEQQLAYWTKRLEGIPQVHSLPLDKPRTERQDFVSEKHWQRIDGALLERLHQLARSHDATLFMVLQTAFALLLARYSDDNDIVMGVPTAGREHADLEPLIGFFINTLVMRTDVTPGRSFSELLRQSRADTLQAYNHQSLPYETLVDELKPERAMAYNPVCQIKFVLQNHAKASGQEDTQLPGLEVLGFGNDVEYIRFDLDLTASEASDSLYLSWSFKQELFELQTIKRLSDSFKCLLEQIVADPQVKLEDYQLLSNDELEVLNTISCGQTIPLPQVSSLDQMFTQTALQNPDTVAVRCGQIELTYSQLNSKANRLADALLEQGVEVGQSLAVCVERSAELLIALLGIMKVGGVYIPLEPSLSSQRIGHILEDSDTQWVLLHSDHVDRVSISGVDVIMLDDAASDANWFSEYSDVEPEVSERSGLDDSAYMIYTSGSTGKPKGVQINQRGLVDYCHYALEHYYSEHLQGSFVVTSHSFDITIPSLYVPLLAGDTVHLCTPTEELQQLVAALNDGMDNQLLRMTPMHAKGLLTLLEDQPPLVGQSHVMVIGGEAFGVNLARQLQQQFPDSQIYNHYGPSETVVGCSIFDVTANLHSLQSVVPIGKPMANTNLYVLDEQGQQCPAGVVGQLYIGGNGVAVGYVNQPQLTAEKFVTINPNGTANGQTERLYLSGDLVRRMSDGNLVFVGRTDDQVKLRGFRIELGEVEAKILENPQIDDVVVMLKGKEDQQQLVAYVISDLEQTAAMSLLQSELATKLPSYMIPSVYMVLSAMPLSANGKVDRNALPEPNTHAMSDYIAPRNEIEQKLSDIWQEVLKVEHIGMDDNFFAIGGDSILSIQVVSRANKAGINITTGQLFFNQTIGTLAAAVDQGVALDMPQQAVEGQQILLPKQVNFYKGSDRTLAFNQSVLLQTPADFDGAFVRELVEALYLRHDALRLRLVEIDGQVRGQYQPFDEDMLQQSVIEQSLPVDHSLYADFITEHCSAYQDSLNLEDGPLFKAVYFKAADDSSGRLFLLAHHVIVDGVSWRILLADMEQAYNQYQQGNKVKLDSKTSSFQQWGAALGEYARTDALATEREYWLSGYDIQVADLPKDKLKDTQVEAPAPATLASSRKVSFGLDPQTTDALLKKCPSVYRTQINELLLAGIYIGMCRFTGGEGLRIALEGHGREHLFEQLDTTQTVGWFTSVYPLTLHGQSDHVSEVIKAVKEQYREIPNNGIGYGALVYLGEDDLLLNKAKAAPASLIFNYLGQFDQTLDQDSGFSGARESVGHNMSQQRLRQYPFSLNGSVMGGVLQFALDYSELEYNEQTMKTLAGYLEQGLRSVVEHCVSIEQGSFTPSDFPLATVSQSQLDQWQLDYPNMARLYPATAMQKGMYFHGMLDKSAYCNQVFPTFTGPLDVEKFHQAWQMVIARHDILRTAFVDGPSGLYQLVQDDANMQWQVHDLSNLEKSQQAATFERLRLEDKHSGFDFAQAPLQKVSLFKLSNEQHIMLWTHHHMILDGWCKPLVYKDVMLAYRSLVLDMSFSLPKPPVYEDYMVWLGKQDEQQARDYWREHLQNIVAPTQLPAQQPEVGASGSKKYQLFVDVEQSQRLEQFAREHRTTLNTLLQLAWGYLLHCFSGDEQVVFGSTISGRPAEVAGIEEMVGLFINTIPVKVDFGTHNDVVELAHQLQSGFQQSQDFGYLSLADIKAQTCLSGKLELFESSMVFENYPMDAAMDVEAKSSGGSSDGQQQAALGIANKGTDQQTNYKLFISAGMSDKLSLVCGYDTSCYSEQQIAKLMGYFERILSQLTDVKSIQDISILNDEQQQQILNSQGAISSNVIDSRCIHQLFEAQVATDPDAVALVCDGDELTMDELNAQANQLANYLVSKGVKPDTLVGICVERSLEMVIGLLAILKAGGAYVPLDPEYPEERIEYMVEDSGIEMVLTCQEIVQLHGCLSRLQVCMMDEPFRKVLTGRLDSDNLSPANIGLNNHHLAYVIYTSGTTGKPKGVLVEHQGLVNLILHDIEQLQIAPQSKAIHCMSISFDAATEHLFNQLCGGSEVHILDPKDDLFKYVNEQSITHIALPTAVLEAQKVRPVDSLKVITLGGEAVSRKLVNMWAGKVRLINQYGPTEATATATSKVLTTQVSTVTIGRPVANKVAIVVDSSFNLCPVGVEGELLLGGCGIARGYLNQPELTTEQFISLEFGSLPAAVYYRTGDRACLLDNGELAFRGRLDNQLKIRGYRIELKEIEASINAEPDIDEAIVIADEQQQLVAYLVVNDDNIDEQMIQSKLKGELSKRLPAYMVPSVYVVLEAIPLTPNGKVDHSSLPVPSYQSDQQHRDATTQTEKLLVDIWQNQLGVDKLGLDDSLFDMGAHSLAFMAVGAELSSRGIDCDIKVLMEHHTVAQCAAQLDKGVNNVENSDVDGLLIKLNNTQIDSSENNGRILWVIHPYGGTVECYRTLAMELDNLLPVYGIQAPFMAGSDFTGDNLSQLAAHYVTALMTKQPQGPYYLGGWSAGGTLAWLMAEKLQADGHQVMWLGLMDAPPPGMYAAQRNDYEYLLQAAEYADKNIRAKVGEDLTSVDFDQAVNRVVESILVPGEVHLMSATQLEQALRFAVAYSSNNVATQTTQLKISGKTVLFNATQEQRRPLNVADITGFIGSQCDVSPLPNDHARVLEAPSVLKIIEQIKTDIAVIDNQKQ